jgi:hypothetical protein
MVFPKTSNVGPTPPSEVTVKPLLVAAPLAAILLAACGTDTCQSQAAQANTTSPSCTLAPGADATIFVSLCAKCTDSSPGCQAEFVNGQLELAPTIQQCQGNLGCDITGCNAQVPQATCQVTLPVVPGTYPLVVVGQTVVQGTLTLGGGGSTCNL